MADFQIGTTKCEMRVLSHEDIVELERWVREEQWPHTSRSIEDINATHPSTMWGAFTNEGRLVSSCSGFVVNDTAAVLDLYITQKAYRKRGIGRKVFDQVIKSLGDREVTLWSVPSRTDTYKESGFLLTKAVIFELTIPLPLPRKHMTDMRGIRVEPIIPSNLAQVMIYDKTIFPGNRDKFMTTHLMSSEQIARCAVDTETGNVCGVIVLRSFEKEILLVCPLYSDSLVIATALLYHVTTRDVPDAKALRFLYVHTGDDHMKTLLGDECEPKVLGLQMSNRIQQHVEMPLRKIYSVTTVDIM